MRQTVHKTLSKMEALPRMPERGMASGAAWMLGAQGIRLLAQAAYYVLLARQLGAEGYGAFVGALATVSLAIPFASMGAGSLLIRGMSRRMDNPRLLWSRAVTNVVLWGSGLALTMVALGWLLMGGRIPFGLLVGLAISDVLLLPLIEVSGQAFQALDRLSRTAQIFVTWSTLKVIAAVTLTLVPEGGLGLWAFLYPLSTGICALTAVVAVSREMGWPRLAARSARGELRDGLLFSLSGSARSAYDDIDKVMLARLGSLGAVGIYGAAYRIIDIAFLPVRSLLFASYPRFFAHGASGVDAAARLARRLLPIVVTYALLVGIALYVLAPLVPLLLGQSYAEVVPAVRWLAILPLFRALHYFAADAITGAGYQGWRTAVQIGVAMVNVCLNLLLIPAYSWVGAAWASILSDGALAVALWLVLNTLVHRAAQSSYRLPAVRPVFSEQV
jgi:O-antigen/teichoic acid export membrane protein